MSPVVMEQDLITVIIPVYNHESYVQETINSIIEQSYKNIELIVLNDGSKDGSKDSVELLVEKCDQRFKYFSFIDKENEGIVKTLNRGIKLAKGRFLYIIASDDVAEKDALKTLHDFLSNNSEYALAVGSNKLIDSESKECFWDENSEIVYDRDKATYFTFDGFLRKKRPNLDFLSDQFGRYTNLIADNHVPNGYLLEKAVVDEFGGYSETAPMEDLYLMLQISKIKKLKFIDVPLFRYRWHDSNTIKNHIKMYQIQRETLIKEFGYCLRHGHILLWFKHTYWPDIKYYFKKLTSLLKR